VTKSGRLTVLTNLILDNGYMPYINYMRYKRIEN